MDSNSISTQTCFLNLLLEFIWTTYLGNLYPIGLPDLTRSAYLNLARTAYLNPTRAHYLSLIQSHQCFPGLIRSYPSELPYLILLPIRLLLTWPNYLTWFLNRSDFYLPGRITLPDPSPDQTSAYRSYPATIPDFLTRPGNTSLHSTAYLALPITLPHWVPFNWPHPKTSSSPSHLDLGLLLADNASR
jgi:hypothetical protein